MGNLEDYDIVSLRNQIDEIDASLLLLFEKRMEVVLKIAEYKNKNNIQILNETREDAVIIRNLNLVKNSDIHVEVEKFFKSVMEISRGYQNKNFKIHEELAIMDTE